MSSSRSSQDVQRARTLPPLTIETMRDTRLGASMDMLISQRRRENERAGHLQRRADVAASRIARSRRHNACLLDTKGESEALVAAQRTRMLWTPRSRGPARRRDRIRAALEITRLSGARADGADDAHRHRSPCAGAAYR